MLINGENYSVDELVNNLDLESNFKVSGSHLGLTQNQIEILERYKIDYLTASSLQELTYLVDEALDDTLSEELELVLGELVERNYYENTNK